MFGTSRSETDLLLLHAPSVYDFRERAILYGPVSDMVPSSTVFEMYPLGFLTIASFLHDRGLKVRIVNLALRMMNSRRFDVPRFLARQKPKAVGIDLHCFSAAHAHGAWKWPGESPKELHPQGTGHHGRFIVRPTYARELIHLSAGGLRPARRQYRAAPASAAHGAQGGQAGRQDCESHVEGCPRDSRQSSHVLFLRAWITSTSVPI